MIVIENLNAFINSLKQYDWFCDVELDSFGRFIVYVKKMDFDIIKHIPDVIDGHHVLFHFVNSRFGKKILEPIETTSTEYDEIYDDYALETDFFPEENQVDLDSLTNELDRLEKICGSNILQDVFYEVHDGKNAVTNLSVKFPEVRESLSKLYDDYGFDVIYEELDG